MASHVRMMCCECGKPKKVPHVRRVVKHQNGATDYVCRPCWDRFDYGHHMRDAWAEKIGED